MTNFEYIMSKMTERNFSDIFCNPNNMVFDNKTLGDQIETAFTKWKQSLESRAIYVNVIGWREYKSSVFNRGDNTYYTFPQLRDKFRKTSLSFQVWLSRQYNSEEWDEK